MEIEEKICNAIQGQINEFYLQRPNIHNKGMVTCILTDDLYSKRLELAKSQKERRLTIESKKIWIVLTEAFYRGERETM